MFRAHGGGTRGEHRGSAQRRAPLMRALSTLLKGRSTRKPAAGRLAECVVSRAVGRWKIGAAGATERPPAWRASSPTDQEFAVLK
jgi:hypothetical protein